jgi:hypothetical protein
VRKEGFAPAVTLVWQRDFGSIVCAPCMAGRGCETVVGLWRPSGCSGSRRGRHVLALSSPNTHYHPRSGVWTGYACCMPAAVSHSQPCRPVQTRPTLPSAPALDMASVLAIFIPSTTRAPKAPSAAHFERPRCPFTYLSYDSVALHCSPAASHGVHPLLTPAW